MANTNQKRSDTYHVNEIKKIFEKHFTNNINEETGRDDIQTREIPVNNSYYDHDDHEPQEQNNNLSYCKRIIPITINEIVSNSYDDEYEIFQKKSSTYH